VQSRRAYFATSLLYPTSTIRPLSENLLNTSKTRLVDVIEQYILEQASEGILELSFNQIKAHAQSMDFRERDILETLWTMVNNGTITMREQGRFRSTRYYSHTRLRNAFLKHAQELLERFGNNRGNGSSSDS